MLLVLCAEACCFSRNIDDSTGDRAWIAAGDKESQYIVYVKEEFTSTGDREWIAAGDKESQYSVYVKEEFTSTGDRGWIAAGDKESQ